MSNTIKIRNSGTSSNVPSALEYGELAINYSDGKLFYKDSSNNIVSLVSENAANIFASDTAPSSPAQKDLWFRTSTGQLFIRYDSHWVEIAMPDKSSATVNTNIGSAPFSPLDLSPVLWLDASDTSSITAADGAWLDGSGLVLPGLSGNYASTPNVAGFDITDDLDIRVLVTKDDWTSGSIFQMLAAKSATAGQGSYEFRYRTNKTLLFAWSANGTNFTDSAYTTALSLVDGQPIWLRVTFDVDDGAGNKVLTFLTSTDGTNWTTHNTQTTVGTTSIFNGTSSIDVGYWFRASSSPFDGVIERVQIRDGIGGTTVFDADFAAEAAGTLSFTEDSTNAATVTLTTTYGQVSQWDDLSGSGNDVVQATSSLQPKSNRRTVNSLNVLYFDGSDSMTAGDKFDLLTGGITIVAVASIDVTSTRMFLAGKSPNGFGAGRYRLYAQKATPVSSADVEESTSLSATNGFTSTDATIHGMRYRRDTIDGLQLWRDGSFVAAVTTVGTTSYNIADAFTIGALVGSYEFFNGTIAELIVVQSALTDTQMADLDEYLRNKWSVY